MLWHPDQAGCRFAARSGRICRAGAGSRRDGVPVIGIGGITARESRSHLRAGAAGVAVIGAVLAATDPEAAARVLRAAVSPA